jgi:hypothetical protein
MSNWFKGTNDNWVNIDASENIVVRPFKNATETQEEWERDPWWEAVASMPSGKEEFLHIEHYKDALIEWVQTLTAKD